MRYKVPMLIVGNVHRGHGRGVSLCLLVTKELTVHLHLKNIVGNRRILLFKERWVLMYARVVSTRSGVGVVWNRKHRHHRSRGSILSKVLILLASTTTIIAIHDNVKGNHR